MTCLKNFLIVLFGIISGFFIGLAIYWSPVFPIWTVYLLGHSKYDVKDIVFFENSRHLAESSLYIRNNYGKMYYAYKNNWELVQKIYNENFNEFLHSTDLEIKEEELSRYVRNCASKWHIPAFGILDSEGIVYNHTIAMEYICYILRDDGRLQVWAGQRDAASMMVMSIICSFIGLLIGLFVCIRKFLKKMPLAT